ncbi:MAG: hypothetical protein U1F04_11375 [Burkholderiaceae bacterium]
MKGQELLGNIDADGDNATESAFHYQASADEISHIHSMYSNADLHYRADHLGWGSAFLSSEVE